MSPPLVIDTCFRTALDRLDRSRRLIKVHSQLDPHLEVSGLIQHCDGDMALKFERVGNYTIPVCANFLVSLANVQTVLETDQSGIRSCMERGLESSLKPQIVKEGPCQEIVINSGIDLEKIFPVLFHAHGDGGKFITGGVVLCRDPENEIYNASIHRMQILGLNRTAIKLDWSRHLRSLYESAKLKGKPLEIAVIIGCDIALTYAASTMGSQVPFERDELEVASGIRGEPLELVACKSINLNVPANSEIVLEGEIRTDEMVQEGPFIEFLGLHSEVSLAPVVHIKTITQRRNPIYYAICGRETTVLRKFALEAVILRTLKTAVPIVRDVNLTDGGLNRFHLVVSVHKNSLEEEGFQRNVIFAAVTALKDLDRVIVVDDDIDIHDPNDVEYALAVRMEASRDLIKLPGARGHEYIPVSVRGMRTKVGIDATVPIDERDRFRRVSFKQMKLTDYNHSLEPIECSPGKINRGDY